MSDWQFAYNGAVQVPSENNSSDWNFNYQGATPTNESGDSSDWGFNYKGATPTDDENYWGYDYKGATPLDGITESIPIPNLNPANPWGFVYKGAAPSPSSVLNFSLEDTRTQLYQREKVITEENNSVLPFKAFPGDRDGIHVLFSSMSSGSRIIATDDTLSLPMRSLQIDHQNGFNRTVYSGPTYGRVIDKVGNPVYDAGFMIGSGIHTITQGNLFTSASEIHLCLGKEREMETEESKQRDLYSQAQTRSVLTMFGKKSDGTLKTFESFYERHLSTIIEGRNTIASRDTFTYKCFRRISLQSTRGYNCAPDGISHYDDIDAISNTSDGETWESKLQRYKAAEQEADYKLEETVPGSDGNDLNSIDLVADDNITLIAGKSGRFQFGDGLTLSGGDIHIKAGRVVLHVDKLIVDGEIQATGDIKTESYVVCRKLKEQPYRVSTPNQPEPVPFGYALDPKVKISKGYDEIPETQKACVEDQMNPNVEF